MLICIERRCDDMSLLMHYSSRRTWIFRPEIDSSKGAISPSARQKNIPPPEGEHTRDFLQTPVSLFRFSALTFNGHKIHYSKEWCQQVEGHRNLVVHGPLNLINMLDLWRDVQIKKGSGRKLPRKISYRATSPIYADEPYRIVLEDGENGVEECKVVDSSGVVGMLGRIE